MSDEYAKLFLHIIHKPGEIHSFILGITYINWTYRF